jgi:hypothetical protein
VDLRGGHGAQMKENIYQKSTTAPKNIRSPGNARSEACNSFARKGPCSVVSTCLLFAFAKVLGGVIIGTIKGCEGPISAQAQAKPTRIRFAPHVLEDYVPLPICWLTD